MDAAQGVLLFFIVASLSIPLVLYLPQAFKTKKIPVYSPIRSVSYSPFSSLSSIDDVKTIDTQMIRKELSILKHYVPRIRTYSMSDYQDLIPGIAIELGMEVSLGIWLGGSEEKNTFEIETAIAMVKKHKNIRRVIVGNESLFRHEVPLWKLKEYISYVKQAVDVPVTCAELWYTWLDNPTLADDTDEITAHVLPFWEGVNVQDSIDYVLKVVATLGERFPDKKIYIGEIGWPSKGQSFISMPCDAYQQAEHIRTLAEALNDRQIDYNVIEAFDQKWKISEGTVGPHWGILSRRGVPKFLLGNKNTVPEESLRVFMFGFFRSVVGKSLLFLVYVFLLISFAEIIWRFSGVASVWNNMLITLCWSLWFIAVSATGMHETLERFLMPRKENVTGTAANFDPSSLKVAFHLACRNEPPQMVINTLFRLSHLDYANYKVHVIDNNTSDEKLWQPVKEYCIALGDKFHFWHVDDLSGFKGGALNFLLEKTDADTDVVAIVDSDYQVESDWLKLLFFFSDPGLAVIQAPQDYRDKDSFFKELCYFEYKSFFNTGMVIRDHFNALILHGTMTLIRANVLRKLGWAEWCVCEDAELGLRVLIDKHKMKYVQISYGQGVMPDRFGDYKRQRARWVAGAIQILVRHSSSIFTLKTELSWRQKYQFFMGWAHWLVQPASLLTTLVVMLWSIIVLCLPTHDFDYPALVSVSLISAFILTLVAQALLYIRYSPDGRHGAMLSIIASQALNYIVAITVVRVLFSHPKNFVVTPKMAGHLRAPSFPMDCLGELVIFLIITALAGFIAFSETDKPYPALWALMLILRGIPYGLAALMSIFSQQQDPDLESDAR